MTYKVQKKNLCIKCCTKSHTWNHMHICLGVLYLNIPCEIECVINIHFKIFLEHICLIYIAYILTCLYLSFITNPFIVNFYFYIIHMCIKFRYKYHEF